jgi:hypothetical protein
MSETVKNYMKNLCPESILVLVVLSIAAVKAGIDRNWVKVMAVVITAVISVMIVDCLCKGGCKILSWVYAVLVSFNALLMTNVIEVSRG